MAVQIIEKNQEFTDFRFNNGDISKLNDVIQKWGFKDPQSFFRYVISFMTVTEDKFLAILENSEVKPIKPNYEYLEAKK